MNDMLDDLGVASESRGGRYACPFERRSRKLFSTFKGLGKLRSYIACGAVFSRGFETPHDAVHLILI
jgi:hypothetical protein